MYKDKTFLAVIPARGGRIEEYEKANKEYGEVF